MGLTGAARLAGVPWALASAARAAAHAAGLMPTRRLRAPTVSIGALEMGGTGKTPAVVAIARLVRAAGYRPAILSRGYGRRSSGPRLVADGSGRRLDVREAGDEPSLMAQQLPGVAVAVAARREQAAALIDADAADLFLLDDGFQHLRVARDVNILVVDARAPFWRGSPPPLGRLREGPAAARRAHAVLVVGEPDDEVGRELDSRLPGRPRFVLLPTTTGPRPWTPNSAPRAAEAAGDDGTGGNPSAALPGPVLAFAAIARPRRFFAALDAAGVEVRDRCTFRDHHWYRPPDVDDLDQRADRCGAAALVTTEKDAIRLEGLAAPPRTPLFVWTYALRPRDPQILREWLGSQLPSVRR